MRKIFVGVSLCFLAAFDSAASSSTHPSSHPLSTIEMLQTQGSRGFRMRLPRMRVRARKVPRGMDQGLRRRAYAGRNSGRQQQERPNKNRRSVRMVHTNTGARERQRGESATGWIIGALLDRGVKTATPHQTGKQIAKKRRAAYFNELRRKAKRPE